ncbi:lipid carrier--UDP-N-acetylgalactosaminyltransferase [Paenibacillus borealis]|uniref:Lipid carrier--UDP-N-acetylgalactosaminyltransferase n=1 Tax=Paenibacillus borealis TaxID=160799 RepID=A0ABX3HEL8_PAEBO|nr:lipid carrier--UDP-N-acetylgalactosaminyltransferase [Paenibacillus borealis]
MKPYLLIKRMLDCFFACLLLIIASPIMFAASIAIMVSSKGPLLFRQKRPGINGEIFTVFKFRTMSLDRDSNGDLLPDIERMTRVGSFLRKTSIDELPQLFNIIRGEMSFIGPRPLLVEYLEYYSKEELRRHDVIPGISGWAQVNGRNSISWDEKFKLDLWYVDHISFLLDLKIVIKTMLNVIRKTGINNSEVITMSSLSSLRKHNS